jgi:hypothetical protein
MALETIVAKINTNRYTWVRDEPNDDDLSYLTQQALERSVYDPLNLREQMFNDLKAGKAKLVCKVGLSPPAKVLAVVYPETKIPWELFGRIFSGFGPSNTGTPWRVIWFAHPRKREFPTALPTFGQKTNATNQPLANTLNASLHKVQSEAIQPVHINGGYAYACQPETIVIYREEEAARVLVHELLHAACTDDMRNPEELREVLTESWAEIFLIGILAKGSLTKAKALWRIQAQWIVDQETVLKEYGVLTPLNYAWRYTVGRRGILEGMGLRFPAPSADPKFMLGGSLRFTSPSLSLD